MSLGGLYCITETFVWMGVFIVLYCDNWQEDVTVLKVLLCITVTIDRRN